MVLERLGHEQQTEEGVLCGETMPTLHMKHQKTAGSGRRGVIGERGRLRCNMSIKESERTKDKEGKKEK